MTDHTVPAAAQPPRDLPALGAFLADQLRAHFPREAERDRQVLALAEEAGEFVGAYRRAAGMARRTGTWDQIEAELADVAITTYVTAHVLGLDADVPPEMHDRPLYPPLTGDADTDRHRAVLNVASAAGWFTDAYLIGIHPEGLASALRTVVIAAHHAAHVLGIDLPAAVHAKTTRILTRGWRDHPEGTAATGPDQGLGNQDGDGPDARQWAGAMLDVADALTYVIETSDHDTMRFQRAHQILFGPPPNDDQDQEQAMATCCVCGCTEDAACPGGCHWVPDPQMGDLCSRCAPTEATR